MAIIAKELVKEVQDIEPLEEVEKVYELKGEAVAPNLGRFSVSQLEAQKVSIQERADNEIADIDAKLAAITKLNSTK